MSALFNFHAFLSVVLLVICTCTYIKMQFPAILEQRTGFRGFFWKAARIGSSSMQKGSLGAMIKLLPCDIEITDSNSENSLLQSKIRLRTMNPSVRIRMTGASCTGLL